MWLLHLFSKESYIIRFIGYLLYVVMLFMGLMLGAFIQSRYFIKYEQEMKDQIAIEMEAQLPDRCLVYNSLRSIKDPNSSSSKDIAVPIVVFDSSSKIDEKQQAEIRTKIINPFFDFYNKERIMYVTMQISKKDKEYNIIAIGRDGIVKIFSATSGNDGTIKKWKE
ncbi:MAG: hypothetical protein WCO06_05475 [Candidatus Roizmanbacteria bacterium]